MQYVAENPMKRRWLVPELQVVKGCAKQSDFFL